MKTFKATIITQYGSIVEKTLDAECLMEASQKLRQEYPESKVRQIDLVKKDAKNIVIYMNGDQIETDPKVLYQPIKILLKGEKNERKPVTAARTDQKA